jgi:hypothetical protein
MTSTPAPQNSAPAILLTEAESRVFAALETAFGDTLWEVLRSYIDQGEGHSQALQQATLCAHWQEAVRRGLKIAALASDLDFRAVVEAVRGLSDAVYEEHTAHARRNAAQMVVLEFERSKLMLASRYPGLVSAYGASFA